MLKNFNFVFSAINRWRTWYVIWLNSKKAQMNDAPSWLTRKVCLCFALNAWLILFLLSSLLRKLPLFAFAYLNRCKCRFTLPSHHHPHIITRLLIYAHWQMASFTMITAVIVVAVSTANDNEKQTSSTLKLDHPTKKWKQNAEVLFFTVKIPAFCIYYRC